MTESEALARAREIHLRLAEIGCSIIPDETTPIRMGRVHRQQIEAIAAELRKESERGEAAEKRVAALESAAMSARVSLDQHRCGTGQCHCCKAILKIDAALSGDTSALDAHDRATRKAALLEAATAIRMKRESTKDWMATTRANLWEAEGIVRELTEKETQ